MFFQIERADRAENVIQELKNQILGLQDALNKSQATAIAGTRDGANDRLAIVEAELRREREEHTKAKEELAATLKELEDL